MCKMPSGLRDGPISGTVIVDDPPVSRMLPSAAESSELRIASPADITRAATVRLIGPIVVELPASPRRDFMACGIRWPSPGSASKM